jgi:hypothetical protein
VVVAFYLIAQMVGAGQLIKLLFGLDYWLRGGHRRRADDGLRAVRRHDRDHLGADHQGLPAAGRRQLHGLHGDVAVRLQPEALFAKAVEIKTPARRATNPARPRRAARSSDAIMGPGTFVKDPISAISFGMALMFGTAGLPHILMRFFTVPERQGSAQVGVVGDHLDRLLLPPDLHHRLRRDRAGADQPAVPGRRPAACSAAATWRRSTWPTRWAATCSSASSRRWPSRPSSRWWPA